jgi:pSer/pThr/pTyr-binding forkhead associated (FHA) protein
VSLRHASLRQKGGEWVLVDEGSANGTFLERVRLPPQTPRVVRTGELVRVGRVFLEVRVEPGMPHPKPKDAARELALELVSRGIALGGEDPWPRVTVVEGPDLGARVTLRDAGRDHVIGRSKECDLAVSDADMSRKQLAVRCKPEGVVLQVYAGTSGASIDGERLGERETPWKPGQEVMVGRTRLLLEHPAADALLEIERGPDELMGDAEVVEPERPARAQPEDPAAGETPAAAADAAPRVRPPAAAERAGGGWGALDGFVILLALGVLAVSIVGWWFLAR